MKAQRKNGKVIIELEVVEASILSLILLYMKEWYFGKLDDAPNKGPGIINPNLIKRIYNDTLEMLTKQ